MLVRRRIQTPSVAGPERGQAEGEVVLGAPPPARRFSWAEASEGRFAPGSLSESLGGARRIVTARLQIWKPRSPSSRSGSARSRISSARRRSSAGINRSRCRRGGAGVRAEQLATLDRIAHEALTSDEIGGCSTSCAGFEESQPVRLGRGEPDPASCAATGRRPAACRPSCAARCRAPPRSRCPCGSKSAPGLRLLAVPAGPAQELRPAPAVRRVLRRLRRAVRRVARRLRAWDEDRRSARRRSTG